MPRKRKPVRISPKRERMRFLQAVKAVPLERVREVLAPDPDMIGGYFLLVTNGRAIIQCFSRMHGRAVLRFSDTVLEVACGEFLTSIGAVFYSEEDAEEYCRRVLAAEASGGEKIQADLSVSPDAGRGR